MRYTPAHCMARSHRQLSQASKATAFLALVLTVLGSFQAVAAGSLGGLSSRGDIGCVDACGCPPSPAMSSCCCADDSEDFGGAASTLALLTSGSGCTPPVPQVVSASPAGPILAEPSETILPAAVAPTPAGRRDTRTLTARTTRPPVPPPRA